MDFNYKPGFKVGFTGYFDYDNWDTHVEYTWFHTTNSNSTAVSAVASAPQSVLPMWGVPGLPVTDAAAAFFYSSANASWKMNMDLIDWDLGRWYYVGTKLTFRPNFGVRAAFIRQRYDVDYVAAAPFAVGDQTAQRNVSVAAKSGSWGVGVKTGLDTSWMIGQGFRVFGNGEADILFTRYTSLGTKATGVTPPSTTLASAVVNQDNHNTVRTHLDLQLGFGWGTYWDCNNWYTDIMLGYEFQVFFDQNMFRHFDSSVMRANSILPVSNLYTQGLTVQFALTF
jgi:hypothetical protein